MSQPPLKPLEIEDLLNQYRSDLRKLEYQIHKTQAVIQELETQAAEVQEALAFDEAKALPKPEKAKPAAKPKARRRPGRPPKAKAEGDKKPEAKEETPKPATRGRKSTAKKKPAGKKRGPGRPPKSAGEKKEAKTPKEAREKKEAGYRLSEWDEFVIKSLQSKQKAMITQDFLEMAKDNPDIKSGEAQIKVKLNRSLHKLSNKKGLLAKVEHSGRGYAYALNDWVNAKGALPKKYAR